MQKVLVIEKNYSIPTHLLQGCGDSFAFSPIASAGPESLVRNSDLYTLVLVGCAGLSEDAVLFLGELRDTCPADSSWILAILPAVGDADETAAVLRYCDDFLLETASAGELALRLSLGERHLKRLAACRQERDFFRQAVIQEERLSRKLLDQQQRLKGTLETSARRHQQLRTEHKRLRKEASFDVLTGLLNRRSLNDRLELEIKRSIEQATLLCGLMIDIDHFKTVNDSFGHQAGDLILSEFAGLLRSYLRRNDHAGRYGGEEFVVLLAGSGLTEGLAIAQRIRVGIADRRFAHLGQSIQVTVSIGVALLAPGEGLARWIGRIDTALYRAKDGGRDRICYHDGTRLLDYADPATSAQR